MESNDLEEFYRSLSVLIVEDDIQVLSVIRSLLIEMGFAKIQGISDGSDALGLIDGNPFDLIVCDWSLPRVSGLEILRYVRSKKGETPFMMVTGMGYEDAVKSAIDLGVTAYVTKPFPINEVERKITAIMKTYSR